MRAILREAAATTQTATGGNLALMRKTDRHGWNVYVLYDPKIMGQMIESGNIEASGIAQSIFGFLAVRPHQGDCWNAGEVKLSAAQKGYGPLMYQYAMNDYAGGLFPDRGSTSQAARAVWQRYNARADVKKSKFDDADDPKTPDPADDCPLAGGTSLDDETAFLNQAYDAPGDASGRSDVMANHQRFLADMATKKFNKGAVEATIENVGDEYFGERYRNG